MAAPIVLEDSSKQVSIKGTFWRDRNSQIQPAELWPTVRAAIVEGPDLERADLAAFADVPEDGHPILKLPYMGKYITALKWSVARARTIEALTLALAPERHPDLLLLYFQCGDSLLHRFWVFHKSVDEIRERLDTHGIPTDHAAELQQRFGRVVQACYQDMDERIGRILEKTRDDNTLVLVISDHGFGEAPFPHPTKTEPYGGNHRDHGVILAAAPWIEPGTTLEGATVLDLMPTLLHLYGAPVASDMPGKLLEPLVPPAVRARKPEVIPSYENKPQTKIPYKNGWPARKFRPLAEDS